MEQQRRRERPGIVMFPLDPKLDWGLANTDVRHLGVISGTYQLPVGSGQYFLGEIQGWRGQLCRAGH